MKRCPRCTETKPLSEYRSRVHKNGNRYYGPYCKPCSRDYQRERRANGYEYKTKRTTEELTRAHWLNRLRKHDLTEQDYLDMLKAQNYSCAICKTDTPWSRSSVWPVDHCHKTGKVRGLLCNSCNRALGQFKDSPEILRAAIAYLLRAESETIQD